jgi:hypothetical protein
MTPQQTRVLDLVREHIHATGIAPTYQEIADELIVSKTRIHSLVEKLVAGGQLTRRKHVHRPLGLPDHADLTIVPTELLRAELARRGEMLEGLVERPAPLGGSVACAAAGCCSRVTVGRVFCRRHWWALPLAMQQALKAAHGRDDLAAYHAAFLVCQKHLAGKTVRA